MATNQDIVEFKLIKSSRGGQKLIEGGFVFDKQRICSDVTHWQCEKKGECKIFVTISQYNYGT